MARSKQRWAVVIDDHGFIRTTVSQMLTRLGIQTIELVESGLFSSNLLHKNAVLIVTDIVMPEKNGLDIIREVRKG